MTPILDMSLHEINRALRPTDACDATFGDATSLLADLDTIRTALNTMLTNAVAIYRREAEEALPALDRVSQVVKMALASVQPAETIGAKLDRAERITLALESVRAITETYSPSSGDRRVFDNGRIMAIIDMVLPRAPKGGA